MRRLLCRPGSRKLPLRAHPQAGLPAVHRPLPVPRATRVRWQAGRGMVAAPGEGGRPVANGPAATLISATLVRQPRRVRAFLQAPWIRPRRRRSAAGRPVPTGGRILSDGRGGWLRLVAAVKGWLQPGRNPFGLYLRREGVDRLAAEFSAGLIGGPRPPGSTLGMYEFAISDPDNTLARVGRPTRLR